MILGRWADMKGTCVAIQGTPEGESGAMRLVRFMATAPPCQSSMPASAPCSCTASVITAWLRISDSSHIVANGKGESSDDGSTEQAPVQIVLQPPSAFMPRNAARTCGAALVIPLAWGT